MKQIVRAFDQQYLVQTNADLLKRMAEIQKLKDSIQAAEALSRCRQTALRRRTDPKVIASSAALSA